MTADAVFSNDFTMPTLGNLSENLNSLFLIQQTSPMIIKTGNIIVLYITCSNPISKNFENHVSEAVLPSTRALYCYAKDNLVIFVECNILLHCQLF